MYDKKHACVLPFNHMAIRPDGRIFPCCIFRWDDVPEDLNIFHKDPFNHPYFVKLREKMLADEYISGCDYCYKQEELNIFSMRHQSTKNATRYGCTSLRDNKPSELRYVDLSISNTCNNKCRMCGPDLSTSWYSDARKLGRDIPKGIVTNPFVESGDFSKLTYLKLLGGEPLMEQKIIKKILKQCKLKDLTVNLITNTSLVPDEELHDLFTKCKRVDVSLSVDSKGKLNEFLRSGSDWNTTVQNLNWFKEREQYYKIYVHSIVSIYNCNRMPDLIDFIRFKYRIAQSYILADGPPYMMPRNLPEQVKQKLKIIIKKQLHEYKDYAIFKEMLRELEKEGDWQNFLMYDNKMNILRNEHWKDHNPKLYSMLKPYMQDLSEVNKDNEKYYASLARRNND